MGPTSSATEETEKVAYQFLRLFFCLYLQILKQSIGKSSMESHIELRISRCATLS